MTAPLRLVFAGTPEFASAHLQALLAWSGADVVAVYTQPDRPAGRGKKLAPSPVKTIAQAHQLALYQPLSLRQPEAQAELAALAPDVLVVVAYGLILPAAVLAIPRLGCVNVHGSILPRWRGAAPVQRAVEAGDAESGVTIMAMDEGLDTGPMFAIARCAIEARETSASLFAKLEMLGPPALIETLGRLAAGTATPQAQDNQLSNYAHKIDKAEATIDWSLPATVVDRKIRAFYPDPIAYAVMRGERIKLHNAAPVAGNGSAGRILQASAEGIVVACGEGALAIRQLQMPGGKVLTAREVLNGRADWFAAGGDFDRAP
ncbi:MAG: methionyl-tRNA formyltransferase [Spongiibacteraceae bacterium]